MAMQENKILERNREIGQILQTARLQKRIPIVACANAIGTSRRRYMSMEQGEAIIGVAELEVLIDFLDVPVHQIWHSNSTVAIPRQVTVRALPGEMLQIVVDVQK